ncbi:type II toxin-antitoxin system RelE/ParE family toxin [Crossiella sp. CA-258035]|uniref:type II toxin-antitoxin system RelE family toxin n=1 Tax=Crossiella sp. CA-258035 TaxID=2981138 RepID=UPI0024BC1FC0|nr:type II toxin-antitoxin system RelE/ParE family toxin [Crossiella sp. CA-258035]WHT18253.1 type II toxin-antitoxin system RelE/ParE family toxin [Crossiella sp. CA-258035]
MALSRPARRTWSEHLPLDVAIGVTDFITGPLAAKPYRVGKRLDPPMSDMHSARVMREWRVLYTIDEQRKRVTIEAIRHRRDAYRSP